LNGQQHAVGVCQSGPVGELTADGAGSEHAEDGSGCGAVCADELNGERAVQVSGTGDAEGIKLAAGSTLNLECQR